MPNQIDNDGTLLFFASRSVLVATDRSSWIPTASAVRYYTVIQAVLLWLLWFPLILSAILLCLLLRMCYGEFRKIDTRHSLDLRDLFLINCTVRMLPSIVSLCRWALNALLFGLMYGAPANRLNRLQTLLLYIFLLMSNSAARFLLLSIVSRRIDRIN